MFIDELLAAFLLKMTLIEMTFILRLFTQTVNALWLSSLLIHIFEVYGLHSQL